MNVYVASPYQVPFELRGFIDEANGAQLVEWRAKAALRQTARLQHAAWQLKSPIFFYSPIAYETAIIDALNILPAFRQDGAYWMLVDAGIMTRMDACVMLSLPGWSHSSGVREELEHFDNLIGAPIVQLLPMLSNVPTPPEVSTINKILTKDEINRQPTKTSVSFADYADVVTHLSAYGGLK